eukprot:2062-Heterococcus_DN1.PRE.2
MDAGGSRAAQKRRKKKGKQAAQEVRGPGEPQHSSAGSKRPRSDSAQSHHHKGEKRNGTAPPSAGAPRRDHSSSGSKRKHSTAAEDSSDDSDHAPALNHSVSSTVGKSSSSGSSSANSTTADPYIVKVDPNDELAKMLLQVDPHDICADPELDSGLKARQLLQWLIAPMKQQQCMFVWTCTLQYLAFPLKLHAEHALKDVDEFYAKHWERRALLIKRPAVHRDYYGGWLSSDDMRTIISQQSLRYGTDLDVTNFVNGRRVTCFAIACMFLWYHIILHALAAEYICCCDREACKLACVLRRARTASDC